MHTLTNSYHGTEYRTRKTESQVQTIRDALQGARWVTGTELRWARRVRAALCCGDCTCATTSLGER